MGFYEGCVAPRLINLASGVKMRGRARDERIRRKEFVDRASKPVGVGRRPTRAIPARVTESGFEIEYLESMHRPGGPRPDPNHSGAARPR